MSIHSAADTCGKVFRYAFLLAGEARLDKSNPVGIGYLVEENGIAKLVERHSFALKVFHHQMLFTSEHSVGCILVVLPRATHTFLYIEAIWKFAHLLKLVDTHNNMDATFFSNAFR